MFKLCRIDIKGSKKIDEELINFFKKLKERYDVKHIYLYGSYARKEFNEGSDIDLLIVGDFMEKFKDRIANVLMLTDLPIEPLCYTPKEFEEMKKKENPFILNVIKESKNTHY